MGEYADDAIDRELHEFLNDLDDLDFEDEPMGGNIAARKQQRELEHRVEQEVAEKAWRSQRDAKESHDACFG